MKKAYSGLNKALIISLLVFMPLAFFGQSNASKKSEKKKNTTTFTPYLFIKGDFGFSWPWAEVAATRFVPDFRSNVLQVNGDLSAGYQLNNWFNVYGNLTRGFASGRLWGSKNSYYAPFTGKNLLFKSDYYGASLNAGLNLSNLISGYKDRKLSVGAHAGLGQVQWKSILKDEFSPTVYSTYGYKYSPAAAQGKGINHRKVALSIPFGLNVDYKINDAWTVYGDYTYTWLDTDVLDGIVSSKGLGGRDMLAKANIGLSLNLSQVTGGSKSMAKKFDVEVETLNKKPASTKKGVIKLSGTPEPLVKEGATVTAKVSGSFPGQFFNKKSVMFMQPTLVYKGGKETLKPIILKGEEVAGNGEMISYKNGGAFNKTYKIAYKKGMENAKLTVTPVFYQYTGQDFNSAKEALANGKNAVQGNDVVLAYGTVVTDTYAELKPFGGKTMMPTTAGNGLVYKIAPSGYQKVTVKTTTSDIYFKVNRANLDWRFYLNKMKAHYQALKNNLSDLNKGWAVDGVEINGWASPEGTLNFNNKLSEYRAQTAARYLKSKIKRDLRKKNNGFAFKSLKDIPFTINANGPDWNGFMKAVANSNIKDKESIVNVINSAPENQREAQIKNMIAIYPQLEKEILPPLRRAVIKVKAFEPKRTDAEISKLAVSPDFAKLSVKELLYAATLTNNLNTKLKIYKNLMVKEPRCWRAVANAGAVETALGNYPKAKKLLMKAVDMNPKAAVIRNSMGILQAEMGNVKNATKCFTKAQSLGADENYNLGVVNIMGGNYNKAVQLLSGSKCDYNLGLAQLLTKNYAAATNTLKCTPESANSDYLLAIIGARQGNKSMMLNYLGKAIKLNASFAKKAANDKEFLKYNNDADFKALTSIK